MTIKPGSPYVAKSGDTFKTLASRAYGDEALWDIIYDANIATTISDPGSPDFYSIVPGTEVLIPKLPELKSSHIFIEERLTSPLNPEFNKNAINIIVKNQLIEIIRGKILTSLDTMVDAWEIEMAWEFGLNPKIDKFLKPFSYSESFAYAGQNLLISGLVFDVSPQKSIRGSTLTLKGFSYGKNLVDSSVKPPYEYTWSTLKDILEIQTKGHNINVYINTDTGGRFDRVTTSEGQTVFTFLSKLATQRGVLITSTPSGDLQILKIADSKSVGILEEGITPLVTEEGWRAAYSGQNRFRTYEGVGASPGWPQKTATKIDEKVKVNRYKVFRVDDTTEGNIEQAITWKQSKIIADALTIPLSVIGWYAPDGSLWQKNTIVTIKAPSLFIPENYDFLIKSVEYISENGNTARLHLVPPQVYTKEPVIEPWESI